MEKLCKNLHQKLVQDLFLNLVNNLKQTLHASYRFKTRYLERGLSKSLKQVNLCFLLDPVSFKGQNYQKQKGLELAISCTSGCKRSSEKFLY